MEYILSQIITIIVYAMLAATYFIKDRRLVLIVNLGSVFCNGVAYFLLGAWAGVGITIVAVIRNVIFMLEEKYKKTTGYHKMDWVVLCFLVSITVLVGVFAFDGFLSLFSVFASIIYTVSVWQHNNKVYRILGIFTSLCGIVYYVFIHSLFGTILESCLLIATIVGVIMFFVKEKKHKLEKVNGIN